MARFLYSLYSDLRAVCMHSLRLHHNRCYWFRSEAGLLLPLPYVVRWAISRRLYAGTYRKYRTAWFDLRLILGSERLEEDFSRARIPLAGADWRHDELETLRRVLYIAATHSDVLEARLYDISTGYHFISKNTRLIIASEMLEEDLFPRLNPIGQCRLTSQRAGKHSGDYYLIASDCCNHIRLYYELVLRYYRSVIN